MHRRVPETIKQNAGWQAGTQWQKQRHRESNSLM